MDRLEIKIDKILSRLGDIDSTLVGQHITLKEHIKRTNSLEKQLSDVEKEIKPIQTHIERVNGGLRVIASIGIVASFTKAIEAIWHRF